MCRVYLDGVVMVEGLGDGACANVVGLGALDGIADGYDEAISVSAGC